MQIYLRGEITKEDWRGRGRGYEEREKGRGRGLKRKGRKQRGAQRTREMGEGDMS